MKHISVCAAAAAAAVLLIAAVGKIVFLNAPQNELENIVSEAERLKTDNTNLEARLNRLSATKNRHERGGRSGFFLKKATKAELMCKIVELQKKTVKMNSFEILPSFYAKPPEDADVQETFETDLSAIQVGPDGMPIGLSSQSDDYKGVEIVPVRFSFTSTYGSLGRFFAQAHACLPVYSVRSFDLTLKGSEIVKGTVVLNFPMAERDG